MSIGFLNFFYFLAGTNGLEPLLEVLETPMLPLHQIPIKWWSQIDSNYRHFGLQPNALPTELHDHYGGSKETRTLNPFGICS